MFRMGAPTTKIETVVIVSPLKVLCLFFAIASFFCLLISVPSTFWLESENLRFGLWLECTTLSYEANSNDNSLMGLLRSTNDKTPFNYKLICTLINKGKQDKSYVLHLLFIAVAINALICGLIAFILLTISLYSDSWVYSSDIKQGIWNNCTFIRTKIDISFVCFAIKAFWIQICGALIIVSLSSCLIGVVLICIGFAHKKSQETKFKYYKAATFVFFVAVILMITALILFPTMFMNEIQERGKDVWYFGWAYGVAWGSTIFLFGASMLLIFDRNKEEIYYRERLYLNEDVENANDKN